MITIYDYLNDLAAEEKLEYAMRWEYIDEAKLRAEQPNVEFTLAEGFVWDIWLSGNSPKALCKELAFYACAIDPHMGAHSAAQRLRELGFDGVHVDGDDGHQYCAYTARNGHQWRLADHDGTGEWRLQRA